MSKDQRAQTHVTRICLFSSLRKYKKGSLLYKFFYFLGEYRMWQHAALSSFMRKVIFFSLEHTHHKMN